MALNVGKVNAKKAAETQHEIEKGNRRYWTPDEGRNEIRIMPPPADHDEYFSKAGFHYQVGPDNRMFPCPKLGGARRTCFLCSVSDKLKKSDDADDVAEGKELQPTKRYLMSVVDVTAPKDRFQVWTAGVKAFAEINYYFADPEWGDVSDLEEGYNFVINRKGQGLGTDYNVKIAKKPSNFVDFLEDNLGDDYSEEMFDELPVLEEFLEYPTDAEMEAAYNGVVTAARGSSKNEEEDEEEEEAPRVRRGSPRFADEPEEEEPSARKKAAAEEEEEPPARKKAAAEAEEPRARRTSGASGSGSKLRKGLRG